MIILHTFLLVLLGAMLDYSGLKPDGVSFWIILSIIMGIFLTYDILISRAHHEAEKEDN